MAIVMVAMLAFGGTYAYFTASTSADIKDQVKTGKIVLKDTAITLVSGPVVPTQNILDSAITVDNTASTVASYIFVTVTADIYAYTQDGENDPVKSGSAITADVLDIGALVDHDENDQTADVNEITTYGWAKLTGAGVPADKEIYWILADNEHGTANGTINFCTEIKFDADNHFVNGTITEGQTDVEDKLIEVTMIAQSIQQVGFDDALAAYTGLQGVLNPEG